MTSKKDKKGQVTKFHRKIRTGSGDIDTMYNVQFDYSFFLYKNNIYKNIEAQIQQRLEANIKN